MPTNILPDILLSSTAPGFTVGFINTYLWPTRIENGALAANAQRVLGSRLGGSTYDPIQWGRTAPGFTLPDLNGDSVRIGAPQSYTIQDVTKPSVVLRVPPAHWDRVSRDGGTTWEVLDPSHCFAPVQFESCWTGNLSDYNASFTQTTGQAFEIKTTRSSDWQVSAEVGAGGGFDVGVAKATAKATVKGTYGEGFSQSSSSSLTTTISQTINASTFQDTLVADVTTYQVDEYPIFGAGATAPISHIVVVTPKEFNRQTIPLDVDVINRPQLYPYLKDHNQGNILSYPFTAAEVESRAAPSAGVFRAPIALGVAPGVSHTGEFTFGQATTAGTSTSWHGGVAASFEATAEGAGVEASLKLEGEYNAQGMTDQTITMSSSQRITYGVGDAASNNNYTIQPFLYWDKDSGAITLDYSVGVLTDPCSSTSKNNWTRTYAGPCDLNDVRTPTPDYGFALPFLHKVVQEGVSTTDWGPTKAQALFSADIALVGGSLSDSATTCSFAPSPPLSQPCSAVSPGSSARLRATVHNYSLDNSPARQPVVRFYLAGRETTGIGLPIADATNSWCTSTKGLTCLDPVGLG